MSLKGNWIINTQIYITELICDTNPRLRKLLRWPLETISKVLPLNFIGGSNRPSIVKWGNEELRVNVFAKKLFLNPKAHIFVCFWSRHVLFEYVNKILATSIRILNTEAQLTIFISFFFWNSLYCSHQPFPYYIALFLCS